MKANFVRGVLGGRDGGRGGATVATLEREGQRGGGGWAAVVFWRRRGGVEGGQSAHCALRTLTHVAIPVGLVLRGLVEVAEGKAAFPGPGGRGAPRDGDLPGFRAETFVDRWRYYRSAVVHVAGVGNPDHEEQVVAVRGGPHDRRVVVELGKGGLHGGVRAGLAVADGVHHDAVRDPLAQRALVREVRDEQVPLRVVGDRAPAPRRIAVGRRVAHREVERLEVAPGAGGARPARVALARAGRADAQEAAVTVSLAGCRCEGHGKAERQNTELEGCPHHCLVWEARGSSLFCPRGTRAARRSEAMV